MLYFLIVDKTFWHFVNKGLELCFQPLFLYVAHQAVHGGNKYAYLQAPLKYVLRFPHIQDEKRKLFAG